MERSYENISLPWQLPRTLGFADDDDNDDMWDSLITSRRVCAGMDKGRRYCAVIGIFVHVVHFMLLHIYID